MTGGDRFDLDIKVGAGAKLSMTTAAAEKIYRSLGPDSEISVRLESAPAARSHGCRRKRSCSIGPGYGAGSTSILRATLACCWPKPACSAAPAWARRWRRDIFPIAGAYASMDRWCLSNRCSSTAGIAQLLAKRAIAGGGAAVASVLKFPGDEQSVATVRSMQQDVAGEVGASSWNGLALVRLVACDGAALRHDLIRVLTALGSGPLPRLWSN